LPLGDWLARELNEQYGVSKKLARRWLDAGAILPLLDALDEVDADHRTACANAINAYRQGDGGLLPMVVCCHEEEYQTLPSLRLQRAVVAQPLSREQVAALLVQAGDRMAALQAALDRDDSLWELLDTPLMLSVAALAFEGQPATTLGVSEDTAVQKQALLAAYIARMLVRKPAHPRYSVEWCGTGSSHDGQDRGPHRAHPDALALPY
jgi:hypothetical protein